MVSVINSKVYCGGGITDCDDIYCYDPSQDKWTCLPPIPVSWFGLGQVDGKLVAVGGKTKRNDKLTNEVYTYDEQSQNWIQTIPPMPIAKCLPGVLSLKSALIVAGGYTPNASVSYTDSVVVFKQDSSQWYWTDPLPIGCCSVPLVSASDKTCFALGGYQKKHLFLDQALYASVDDLFCNAIPADQATHRSSSDAQSAWKSAWKSLPNTPSCRPAAAMLAGNLLALEGKETTSYEGANRSEVYMYHPLSNSWIYISDLPAPHFGTAVAALSATEILVMGGWGEGCNVVNSVYKGALHLGL